MRLLINLVLPALIVLATPLAAKTGEPLLIGTLLDDPGEYHLTTVTLSGMVTGVTAIAPYYIPSGAGCYGAYTFTLRDASGSLPIAVLGICGVPIYRPPTIAEGDHVIVHAHIQAPGKSAQFKEQAIVPALAMDPDGLMAIAARVEPVTDPRDPDE